MTDRLYSITTGQGPDVVFIHGWGLNHGIWTPLAEKLQQKYRVTLVDLPGFGHSEGQIPSPYSLESICEQVKVILPDSCVLVGWSLGGLVAQSLALDPQVNLRALVTVCSTAKFSAELDWPGIEGKVLAMFQQQLSKNFSATLDRFLAIQAMGSASPKQDLKRIKTLIEKVPMPNPQALAGGLDILADGDLRDKIKHITVPSLRMYGRLDSLVPAGVIEKLTALHPTSEVITLKKASHGPFISHPEEFEQHLTNWLQKLK